MLMPKRVKRRRQFRGRMKGRAHRGNTVSHGEFGLVDAVGGEAVFTVGFFEDCFGASP